MYTVESFCNQIWGIPYSKVQQKISKDDYKDFFIAKKGGARPIHYLEDSSDLFHLQKRLLVNFLACQSLPVCVKGFRKGENYHSFLSEHIGAKFFLRLDVAEFFPSICEDCIKREISNILACNAEDEKEKILALICDIVTLNGGLPQGACTSPAVSNLIMARIDQRITKYCQVFQVRYTRYADDLLFSSIDFNFSEKGWFLKKIKFILRSQGLRLNYSKMKLGQDELPLNGYVISADGLRLSRNRLSDIRSIVSYVEAEHPVIASRGAAPFLRRANQLPLRHRNLRERPFSSIFQLTQYMCGYRAHLISLAGSGAVSASFQKELQRLIRRIETQIIRLT